MLRYVFGADSAQFQSGVASPAQVTVNNRLGLAFDAAADESCFWECVLANLTFPVTLDVYFVMASATTGNVRWQAAAESITPADATDIDAGDSWDADVSNGGAVPGTAGYLAKTTLTFATAADFDDSATADLARVRLRRDADGTSGTDDASGDAILLRAALTDAA